MEPPSYELLNIISLIAAPTMVLLLQSVLVLFLLVCSAVVSGSEVAYFSLSPAQLEELRIAKDGKSSRVVNLLDNPKKLLATILIANNLINVAIIILSNYVVIGLLPTSLGSGWQFFIQVVAVTFLILLIGEVIPKVYANKHNLSVARGMSRFLIIMRAAFSWLSSLLISSTSIIEKRIPKRETNISVDVLEHALELTNDEDTTDEEQKILKGIVRFGNTDVKQIMKPRTDVIAFEYDAPYDTLIPQIIESGFSRIPVYKESFDQVVGILYIKDLLPHLNEDNTFKWQDLIRSPFFVPENKKIDDLLEEFQDKKIHLAVVVDEYGGTSGVVTLEDIIEEIVGDITDEFDDDDLQYSKIDENNYVFEGKTALNDIYRVLNIDGKDFEEHKGEADTLAGFLLELSGKIMVKNEKTTFDRYVFTVEAADIRRIKRVKVTIKEAAELNTEQGNDQ